MNGKLRAVPDLVDEAIAATEQPAQVQMAQTQRALLNNPGRPILLALPPDVTDMELLNAVAHVLSFGDELRARRATPASRLILPS